MILVNKGTDEYLDFCEDLQIEAEKFGWDFIADKILELQQENKNLKERYHSQKNINKHLINKNREKRNIIDELGKWLKGYWELLSGMPDIQEQAQIDILHEVSDKIEELKGNKEV